MFGLCLGFLCCVVMVGVEGVLVLCVDVRINIINEVVLYGYFEMLDFVLYIIYVFN